MCASYPFSHEPLINLNMSRPRFTSLRSITNNLFIHYELEVVMRQHQFPLSLFFHHSLQLFLAWLILQLPLPFIFLISSFNSFLIQFQRSTYSPSFNIFHLNPLKWTYKLVQLGLNILDKMTFYVLK